MVHFLINFCIFFAVRIRYALPMLQNGSISRATFIGQYCSYFCICLVFLFLFEPKIEDVGFPIVFAAMPDGITEC